MIWESKALMTAIDVAIIGVALGALIIFWRRGTLTGRDRGSILLLLGLGLTAGLYVFDLITMWVLPLTAGPDRALAAMENLHHEWEWLLTLVAMVLICAGFLMVHKQLGSAIARAEKATGALLASEGRFRALFEQAVTAIAVTDLDGTIQHCNASMETLLGAPAARLIGRRLGEFVHPDDRAEWAARGRRLAAGELDRLDMEARLVPVADALRWSHLTSSLIRDASGAPVARIALLVDITQRKRLEEDVLTVAESERRRLGLDLHDGLGQLLTGLGLMVKAIESELTRNGRAVPGGFGELGEVLGEAVSHTRFLARGLLAVPSTDTDLGSALIELSETAEGLFGRPIEIEADPEIRVGPAESVHLYMIAREAVTNAIRHGGATRVKIGLHAVPGGVRLSVRDDGEGIPSEPDRVEGVGLRSMRIRAAELGGQLSIERAEAGGTTLVCTVPSSPRVELADATS